MCCRFYMEMSPKLRPIVEAALRSRIYQENISRVPRPLTTEGEVCPGALVPVVASNRSGDKAVFPMQWGYNVPGVNRTIANARSETAAEKPSFREGWATHRCVIPASWYYEWEHTLSPSGKTKAGDKYAILPRGSDMTWLCGIYRMENNYPHFVILTRESSEPVSLIHDRMPFILPEKDVGKWIDPNINPHVLLASAVTDMVFDKEK